MTQEEVEQLAEDVCAMVDSCSDEQIDRIWAMFQRYHETPTNCASWTEPDGCRCASETL